LAQSPELMQITVPDGTLCVEVAGASKMGAPSIVMLHGFGGERSTWDGLWPALGAGHRCVRYDMRGFGASAHYGEGRFSHAEDAVALLDALGIEKAVLVGVSQGGAVAMDVALAQPARVAGLVLISPGLSGWPWSADWGGRWRDIVTRARAGEMDAARRLWWDHPLFDSLRGHGAGAAYAAGVMAYSGREWLRDYQLAPASPAYDRLGELLAPILLLGGGRDVADFTGIADHIAAHAPNCRPWVRADLGHMLHLEDTGWALCEITHFLDEIA